MRASSACMRSRATSCDLKPADSCFNSTILALHRFTSFCMSNSPSIIFWLFARSSKSCFSSSATASASPSTFAFGDTSVSVRRKSVRRKSEERPFGLPKSRKSRSAARCSSRSSLEANCTTTSRRTRPSATSTKHLSSSSATAPGSSCAWPAWTLETSSQSKAAGGFLRRNKDLDLWRKSSAASLFAGVASSPWSSTQFVESDESRCTRASAKAAGSAAEPSSQTLTCACLRSTSAGSAATAETPSNASGAAASTTLAAATKGFFSSAALPSGAWYSTPRFACGDSAFCDSARSTGAWAVSRAFCSSRTWPWTLSFNAVTASHFFTANTVSFLLSASSWANLFRFESCASRESRTASSCLCFWSLSCRQAVRRSASSNFFNFSTSAFAAAPAACSRRRDASAACRRNVAISDFITSDSFCNRPTSRAAVFKRCRHALARRLRARDCSAVVARTTTSLRCKAGRMRAKDAKMVAALIFRSSKTRHRASPPRRSAARWTAPRFIRA
mmetsp:Transcript_6955/g.24517  ORF Transcript_6955/g.24517 Transcript_6955/m.24517 type:complete len:504 (+) Transcript_6955:195-1706(+)